MNEPVYIIEGDHITVHRDARSAVHEQGEFVIARNGSDTHQIYFLADDYEPIRFRRAGGFGWRGRKYIFACEHPILGQLFRVRRSNIEGTLQHCIAVISGIKPPPDPFLEHEL